MPSICLGCKYKGDFYFRKEILEKFFVNQKSIAGLAEKTFWE
jgi:hypothetical protein